MRFLYIHGGPVQGFEVLDERSEMRGHRRRESVVSGAKALPD